MAVVLAGAAFEAYLEPTGGEGFQQATINGSKVTYTDRDFLTQAYEGVLQLQLVGASNLRPANRDGTSDPYAQIQVANCSCRSKIIPRSLNPQWKQTFWMYIRDPAHDVLRVRLFDAEAGRSDQDLGLVMLPLSRVVGSEKQRVSIPVQGPGAGSGAMLTLEVAFLRFADTPPDLLAAMTSSGTLAGAGALTNMLEAAAQVPQLLQSVLKAQESKASDPAEAEGASGSGAQSTALATTDPAAQQAGLQLPGAAGSAIAAVMQAVSDLQRGAASQQAAEAKAAGGDDAAVAVAEADVPNPWRVLARMAGRAMDDAYVPVAFVNNDDSDSQAWLYRNTVQREAIIAFRGTEQVKWKDLATDLNLTPCSLNPERVDSNAGLPFTMRLLKSVMGQDQAEEMVHSGFLSAYDSIRPQIFTLLDLITTGVSDGEAPWKVWVTGHSLGGALSTLCAYELACRKSSSLRAPVDISLYTYGAPRVGNKAFAKRFNQLVPDTWRIANSNDIIPSVPRLLGYSHVGLAVRLAADGSVTVRAESRDYFGEGKGGAEVVQRLVQQVVDQARPWDEVYEEVKARELELLDRLVDGRGLEEHMETFYLSSLQLAIQSKLGDKKSDGPNSDQ